jgi:hypothetical protein
METGGGRDALAADRGEAESTRAARIAGGEIVV